MRKNMILTSGLLAVLLGLAVPAGAVEPPAISATSAVLMDGETGRILYEKNAREPRPIASITKLMTALVAVESSEDLKKQVEIRPEWTGIEGTSLYLRAGEKISLETLLYGLLLQSGNDAAVALAGACAGQTEQFVIWMNARAEDLGMSNTHFATPNGLQDEGNYSSALDMAKLAAACLEEETIAQIVGTKSITLEGRSLVNHNKLLWRYPGCTGMKTGYTKLAGRTLVSSAQRGEQTLLCVTLGDPDDWTDHAALLDYGFTGFPRQVLAQQGELGGTVPLQGSLLHRAETVVRTQVAYPCAKDEMVRREVLLPEQVTAPLTEGEIAGLVRFYISDQQIGESYLVWKSTIACDLLEERSGHKIWNWLKQRGKGSLVETVFSPGSERG